jgi:hypothetical protein
MPEAIAAGRHDDAVLQMIETDIRVSIKLNPQ